MKSSVHGEPPVPKSARTWRDEAKRGRQLVDRQDVFAVRIDSVNAPVPLGTALDKSRMILGQELLAER